MSDMASGMAMPSGNASAGSNVQAARRARARGFASLPVTDSKTGSDTQVRRVAGSVADAGRWVVADFRNAWPWRGQAPSVLDHLAARPERHRVAGGTAWLYTPWALYHYAVALPAIAVLSTLMWLVQHPLRLLPTVAVVLLLLAMWF